MSNRLVERAGPDTDVGDLATEATLLDVLVALAATLTTTPDVPSSYDQVTAATSGVISAAPATVYEFFGFNESGVDLYFQVFNLTAVPIDGAVPATLPILVPAGEHFSVTYSQGRRFGTGVCWAGSTTRATKTAASGISLNCQYRL